MKLLPVNISRIVDWISQRRIDPRQAITIKELVRSGIAAKGVSGVKLLANGSETLTFPINIIVTRASLQAIQAVEKAGGTVTTRYYTPLAVRKITEGLMDPTVSLLTPGNEQSKQSMLEGVRRGMFRLPDPTKRRDFEYYRDKERRGYLSHLVKEGEGPSLFFRVPGTGIERKIKTPAAPDGKLRTASAENRIF